MIKISIILPTYNMSKYLDECLKSIIEQSVFRECEIIVIDDGSTDGTNVKIKNYAEFYSNIFLFTQKHKGSGEARNLGLLKATGRYVTFMDADDFYPTNDVLEKLYYEADFHEAQMCGGSMVNYKNGIFSTQGLDQGLIVKKEGWIQKEDYPTLGGFTSFIYKRQFLIDNNICFPDYLRDQDPPFFVTAIAMAKQVYRINKVVYCYRRLHKKVEYDERKAIDQIYARCDVLKIASDYHLDKIYNFIVMNLHDVCGALLYRLLDKGYIELLPILKEFNRQIEKSGLLGVLGVYLFEEDYKNYLEKIKKNKENLLIKVQESLNCCLFGAGVIGKNMLYFLKSNNLFPDCFIVTDLSENVKIVDGVPVYQAKEYLSEHPDAFVIIAVYNRSISAMKDYLDELDHRNYYLVSIEQFLLFEEKLVC